MRASIGFRDLAVDLERHIYGLGGSWVKKSDGYYYYTDILKTGESTDLFKGIQIPANFPQEAEGSAFHLDISVDAIQSQNFTPDFSSGMPWGTGRNSEVVKSRVPIRLLPTLPERAGYFG